MAMPTIRFVIVSHVERQEPMFPWSTVTRGRFEELTFESEVLKPLQLHLFRGRGRCSRGRAQ
jgi:hypothetical protein